ncbi:hypothetical protein [Defluviimonas salinarum]|uniref:Uncharacterized protein n=1 Tax=Defluviimonas salinarum TaxID=2992147 RepID=A0ABT3JAD9_9RHOB|nr:hypothetical protein [Defluviimonas salinarum]MCW3784374.1 hypothetical protein [Defluviimonas salinarum]
MFTSFHPDKDAVLQAACDTRAYLDGWSAAFRECDELQDGYVAACYTNVDDMLAKVGATKADLAAFKASKRFDLREHLKGQSPRTA